MIFGESNLIHRTCDLRHCRGRLCTYPLLSIVAALDRRNHWSNMTSVSSMPMNPIIRRSKPKVWSMNKNNQAASEYFQPPSATIRKRIFPSPPSPSYAHVNNPFNLVSTTCFISHKRLLTELIPCCISVNMQREFDLRLKKRFPLSMVAEISSSMLSCCRTGDGKGLRLRVSQTTMDSWESRPGGWVSDTGTSDCSLFPITYI